MDRLKVSELAGAVGTSPDALRYYERIGLLSPPERSPSGYRLYDLEAVERVRFIKRAQRFGLRLADIASLIAIQERGLCPCGGTRRLLEARMNELDDEMAALRRLRQEIGAMLADAGPVSHGGPAGHTNGGPAGRATAGSSACGPFCGAPAGPAGPPTEGVRTTVPLMPTRGDPHRVRKGAL
ncbi:MAG: heavy metal-responsive transcriptional regulator [Actinomycetota bacterium]|nr:heavy metal-responsive transcriptional regulator [Actinomycetota bacterium]